MQAGVQNRIVCFGWQAVLHNVLDFAGRRADSNAHHAAGSFVAFGRIVGQADSRSGHQAMAGFGYGRPQAGSQLLAFFDTVALGSPGNADLILAHLVASYVAANSAANSGCSSLTTVCSTESCRR